MSESPGADLSGDDVIVIENQNGALLVGDQAALDAFVAEWESRSQEIASAAEVTGNSRTRALAAASNVASVGVAPVRYLQAGGSLGAPRGSEVVIRKWVKAPDGKIIENSRIDPKLLMRANPEVLLASAAIQFALADATREIRAAIERVEDKTDDLLRLANADLVGDVHGHFRLLTRMVAAIDEGKPLSGTDWSSVASLGPTLETVVERVRNYLARVVGDLPAGLPADERSERLAKATGEQRLGEMLQLLTVSQQSVYLWQRLRIERVDAVEPEHLAQTIDSAHTILADQLKADLELVTSLRETLTEYGALTALEFHRKISGRRLDRNLGILQADFDLFLQARGLQLENWAQPAKPTAKDALDAAGKAIADQGRSVRALGAKAFDKTLDGVGRAGGAVQDRTSRWRRRPTLDASPADRDEK